MMFDASTVLDHEKKCGISEYTNCVSGTKPQFSVPFITGVLKQRYADFQVYEIDRDNQKAVIDSLLKRSPKSNSLTTILGS